MSVRLNRVEATMRGPERNAGGSERNSCPPILHFSTDLLPPTERLAQWQDVVGRTLTGCVSSPIGEDFRADFGLVAGDGVRLALCNLHDVRNYRDKDCTRDGDDDFVFFLMLDGAARLEHEDERVTLSRGEGVLARFDRTLDTSWPDARVMLIRLARDAMGAGAPDRAFGLLRPRDNPWMRLLDQYVRTAWQGAGQAGGLPPMMARHIAELVGAACTTQAPENVRAREAAVHARVAAMCEVIRTRFADPCLSMRKVAASQGLSERGGYLAFAARGVDFTEFLHAVRLDRSRELLVETPARVIDVAYAVGFSDPSHFHRLFKRRFGCTPGEARQLALSETPATQVK
jgi:AraC-like DNA-binding protein